MRPGVFLTVRSTCATNHCSLTREALQIKTMLTRYAEAVLHELQAIDKEQALRKRLEAGKAADS